MADCEEFGLENNIVVDPGNTTPPEQSCEECAGIFEVMEFGVDSSLASADTLKSIGGQFQDIASKLIDFSGGIPNPEELANQISESIESNIPTIPSISSILGCPGANCVGEFFGNTGDASQIQSDLINMTKEFLNDKVAKNLSKITENPIGQIGLLQEALSFITTAANKAEDKMSAFSGVIDCLNNVCPNEADEIKKKFDEISDFSDNVVSEDPEILSGVGIIGDLRECLKLQVNSDLEQIEDSLGL